MKSSEGRVILLSKPKYLELTEISESEYDDAIKNYKQIHKKSSKTFKSSSFGGRKTNKKTNKKTNRNKKYLKRRSIKLQR